jgi:sialate O-acetylesterase
MCSKILPPRAAILVIAATATCLVKAEVRLPKILSSHMVLQRGRPIHLWGWSNPGERVSAALNGVTQSTSANQFGQWSLYLPPQSAGGPFQLTVTSSNTVVLDDVLIGDVWFASGQSNMEMPLKGFPGQAALKNSAEEISHADQPTIRLLFVRHKASAFPLKDYEQSWTGCTPETAAGFSAVAYFFGRQLNSQQHVPIGLIDSTWGGTPGEAWVSLDGLSSNASLMPVFAASAQMRDAQADLPLIVKAEKAEDAAARAANQQPPKHPWHPDPSSWYPAYLFNGMVAPALPYAIKGVIWYQGESNSGAARAPMYERVFRTLISDWRTHWRQGNFPFLFVQLANFKSDATETWAMIRDAQRRTLSVANTGMAVTIDIGDPDNVHPADKQTVGARLALAARAMAYGENIEYSGPLFRQTSTEDGGVRVWFDHDTGGLVARGDVIQGFEIAGEDHQFVSARANIDGSSVLVTNSQIERPKYVRYGWANSPTVNLYNSLGLPASPFTSEETIPAP